MKNLKLENFGVQEMDAKEMINTGGEGFPWAALGIAIAISAINNWGDIREGWHDGGTGKARH
ncbi:hypothetical protein CA265_16585 [Sphingobacteriaceae bacterium GW460-11-11-14-LB5]|nr:hypothetical protein CA265_16585 [Sphingobacteriaceae bacterium GW460-11-11-14-LB5]